MKSQTNICCLLLLVLTFMATYLADAKVHYHEFVIQPRPVKRLCITQNILTVNGQFPGPALEVVDGDTLVIKATNAGRYNATLHWHGVRQMRNPWADGPEYITQCPITPGGTYTYRFTIEKQEGTLWWHAHSQWLRATVHGALIIYPKSRNYPFPKPAREYPVILGDWWKRDPMSVLMQARITGAAPNTSDTLTINGQPGDLFRCSRQDTTTFPVNAGETVLLRIINAALNTEMFYGIANHRFTVVAVDSLYTKPFSTNYIVIGPGQTTDVLVQMDQPPARYYMAAHAYRSGPIPIDNTTTTAILEYKSAAACGGSTSKNLPQPPLPSLPFINNTNAATVFNNQLRSLATKADVPLEIDENLIFTVGLGLINCSVPNSNNCQGPNNTRFTASINNVSFQFPTTSSLMQAYYQGIPGVFTTDFPPVPPVQFDYTGNVSRGLWQPAPGTKVYRLKYGSRVQVVFQGTSIVNTEEHPMHLHGYEFYVVGQGVGNFNPQTDPARFNLVDPPERNTVGSVPGGWTAIRFVADNPGIWFVHCHIDTHIAWGLDMAFLVENGIGESQSVLPPPPDLPPC